MKTFTLAALIGVSSAISIGDKDDHMDCPAGQFYDKASNSCLNDSCDAAFKAGLNSFKDCPAGLATGETMAMPSWIDNEGDKGCYRYGVRAGPVFHQCNDVAAERCDVHEAHMWGFWQSWGCNGRKTMPEWTRVVYKDQDHPDNMRKIRCYRKGYEAGRDTRFVHCKKFEHDEDKREIEWKERHQDPEKKPEGDRIDWPFQNAECGHDKYWLPTMSQCIGRDQVEMVIGGWKSGETCTHMDQPATMNEYFSHGYHMSQKANGCDFQTETNGEFQKCDQAQSAMVQGFATALACGDFDDKSYASSCGAQWYDIGFARGNGYVQGVCNRGDDDGTNSGGDSSKPSEGDDSSKPSEGDDSSKPSEGGDSSKPSEGDEGKKDEYERGLRAGYRAGHKMGQLAPFELGFVHGYPEGYANSREESTEEDHHSHH